MTMHNASRLYMAAALLVPGSGMLGFHLLGKAPAQAAAYPPISAMPILETLASIELPEPHIAPKPIDASSVHSPFWFDEVVTDDPGVGNNPDPRDKAGAAMPRLEVSAILPSPRNPLAVINGKPRRIGEELDGGWRLQSIDGDARTITLVHPSGQRMRVGLKKTP